MKNRPLVCVFIGSQIFLGGLADLHALVTRASVFVGEGDAGNLRLLDFDSSTQFGVEVTASGSSSHTGGAGQLGYSGNASATATSFDTLRARAGGTLTNSFFDENYVFDNGNDEQEGVPNTYVAQASASIDQTLAWGGTATNYTSTYIFRLTGNITGTSRAAVIVTMRHADELEESWLFQTNGSYSIPINSSAYIHGASPQTFSFSINTLYSFDTQDLAPGGNFSGSANFGSTLELLGIDSRDQATGELVSAGTITNGVGDSFNILAVPEPSTALSSLLALAGLTFRSRKSKVFRAA